MKRNLEKEIYRENERREFYSLYLDFLNTNKRRLFISVCGTQIYMYSHCLRQLIFTLQGGQHFFRKLIVIHIFPYNIFKII